MASRFPQRDRSPRYGDRRPPPHGPGSRGVEDANSIPLGREPPRGPKALVESHSPRGGGGHFGRGRGFGGRGDFRDRDRDRDRERDQRDLRDGPPPYNRRDSDRDWPRRDRGFDSRESRPPPFGRGRSRSPPPLRDFRDARDHRDLDLVRPGGRVPRDGPGGPSPLPDLPPFRGGSVRGGRGRGDRDRGRGRGTPMDDRDLFRRRSRSRETWRDRERDRFDRREDDRRSDRDEREPRPMLDRAESWKDHQPPRVDQKLSAAHSMLPPPAGPQHQSPVPLSSASSTSSQPLKIASNEDNHESLSRKPPIPNSQGLRDARRLLDHYEGPPPPPPPLSDASVDRPSPQFSPPPSAPEVPAFGSIAKLISEHEVPAPPVPSADFGARKSLDSGPVRPPTGPKADRMEQRHPPDFRSIRPGDSPVQTKNEISLRPKRAPGSPQSLDHLLPRHDNHSHSVYSGPPPGAGPALPLQRPTTPDPTMQTRLSMSHTPTGPRPRSSGSPTPSAPSVFRRLSSSGRGGSPPQSANRVPITSPRLPLAPNIPTAPRAFQQRGSVSRGSGKLNNQWVRPGYSNQTGPGQGPVNSSSTAVSPKPKRESWDENSASGSPDNHKHFTDRLEPLDELDRSKLSAHKDSILIDKDVTQRPPGARPVSDHISDIHPAEENDKALPLLFSGSSGEESDEEDDLDEEDFNQGEQKFEREMQALAAEMPPQPLEDPVIVGLLLKIQMLGMIAESAVPACLDIPGAAMEIERPHGSPTIIPLSSKDANEIDLPGGRPSGDADKLLDKAIPLPSIESLPFLNSGPPTPFSDMDTFQETLKTHDRIKDALRDELSKQRKEIAERHERLKEEYAHHYRPWRIAVNEMDRKKEETKTETAPATPPPVVVQPPVLESRRGYRLNSELDFQNALKASAITAQEESARRRDKEASAKPDFAKEALIPNMLDPIGKKGSVFRDTNQMVDAADAVRVFAFYPPPNDFTPTEHKIFTDAFMNYPKKWGKIAESLPGRTFQQCVTHYYLTKEEIKYKAKLNKKWTTKKGRGRKVVKPAKTNALIADLGVSRPDYDGDEPEVPAVTDSGRPRRAAAPTFGESNVDTESSGTTPNPGKRGNNQNKDANGEVAEKQTTSRRGGRGGGRGGRRQKAAAAAVQQQQQQPSTTTATTTTTVTVTPIAAAPPKLEPETSATKEATNNNQNGIGVVPKEKEELGERSAQETAAAPRAKGNRGRAKEPTGSSTQNHGSDATDSTAAVKDNSEPIYGSLQPTSYWSVQEQRDFPDLISHYGKDFEAISAFMKTKTPTMVKNYFQRKIDHGTTELEQLAFTAEAKKRRGEPTGPLPTPSAMPKRRYEATPSSVGPRPLAPNTEAAADAVIDNRSLAPKSKPAPAAGPPLVSASSSIQVRPSIEKAPRPLAQAAVVPKSIFSANDDPQGSSTIQQPVVAQQQQRLQQGPRIGYFSDDRRGDMRQQLNPSHLMQESLDAKPHAPPSMTSIPIAGNVVNMSGPHEVPRRNLLSRPPDMPESSLRYQQLPPQSTPLPQAAYLHSQQTPVQATLSPRTHSRRASRTISSAAVSPIQQQPPHHPALKLEPDQGVAIPTNELYGSKPRAAAYLASANLAAEMSRPSNGLVQPGPPKELARPSSTPAQAVSELPRHVPAKRSNIMSILNDEPEEPQPRKRFASDQQPQQSTSASATGVYPPSRPVYHPESASQAIPQQQQSRAQYAQAQHHQQHHLQQHQQQQPPPVQPEAVRQYPEQQHTAGYPGGPGASGPSSQDWVARFDPRGPQQSVSSDTQISRLSNQPTPVTHPYTNPPHTLMSHQSGIHALAQQQQQQQQQSQPQVQLQQFQHHALQPARQPPATHAQSQQHGSMPPASRESPRPQHPQAYRPGIGSPVQRHHNISYAMRGQGPSSPVQAPLQHPQHQHQQHLGQGGPYASESHHGHHTHHGQQHQHQHMLGQSHPGKNTYSQSASGRPEQQQQHQPPMAQHQRTSSLTNLAAQQAGQPPYGRSTPPPQSHVQPLPRHASGVHTPVGGGPPSSLGLGRSYTPPQPSVLHHQSHHPHAQPGGYPSSGGPPPLHPAHPSQQNLAQIHMQPGQSGPGPTGQHGMYPQDPR